MGICVSKAGMFVSPEVQVKTITYRGVSLAGVSIDATLEVKNPNPGTLHATGIRYRVAKASDGTVLAEGTGKKFDVASMSTSEVDVPVTFAYMGLGAAGMSLIRRNETTLLVTGEITFDAPYTKEGMVKVPFSGEEKIVIEDPNDGFDPQ